MQLLFIVSDFLALLVLASRASGEAANLQPLIVGGTPAEIAQFPYQVSVRKNSKHACGGSIISKNYILTAAHCCTVGDGPSMTILSPSIFSIRAGSTNVNSGGVVVAISQLLVHPNYLFPAYDICVLTVKTPLTTSGTIQAISLATNELVIGSSVIASGWGFTTPGGGLPTELQQVTLKAITNAQCAALYGNMPPSIMCLKSSTAGQGICQGDSGGPGVQSGILYGVVSFSPETCANGNPDGFTKVSYVRSWIVQNFNLN